MIDLLTSITTGDGPPLGYSMKGYAFVLEVEADGSRCSFRSVHDEVPIGAASSGKTRLTIKPSAVPTMTRSNNPPPILGCDTAAFVLGSGALEHPRVQAALAPTDKDRNEAAAKASAFRELIAEYAASVEDATAAAFLAWSRQGQPGLANEIDALSEGTLRRLLTDIVALTSSGRPKPLHETPTAEEFWAGKVLAQKSSGQVGLCLSCGTVQPLVDTLPQSLTGAHIPGTQTAQVALISANFAAVGRTHSGTSQSTAPLCGPCAAKAVTNLNALAANDRHRFVDPDGTEATVWFSPDRELDDEVYNLASPDPEVVTALLKSPVSGDVHPAKGWAEGFLTTLTFSGNIARFVPRGLTRTPISQVRASIRSWFQDTAVIRHGSEGWYPIPTMAASTGPLRRAAGGSWTQHTPHGTAMALFGSAIHEQAVPRAIISAALQRARAEQHLADEGDALVLGRINARLALMRLHLNRTIWKEHPVDVYLDKNRDDPAYLAGRLFALSAELQDNAHRMTAAAKAKSSSSDASRPLGVNAGIVDKYFARAMQSPGSIRPGLAQLAERHLRMIRRANDNRLGWAAATANEFGNLSAKLGDRLSGRLSLDQQAAWLAGFYQQQQYLAAESIRRINEHKAKAADGNSDNPEGNPA